MDHTETILNNPRVTNELRYGRSAYWGNGSGTIVIRDPKALDGGADFQPTMGKFYFDETIK